MKPPASPNKIANDQNIPHLNDDEKTLTQCSKFNEDEIDDVERDLTEPKDPAILNKPKS